MSKKRLSFCLSVINKEGKKSIICERYIRKFAGKMDTITLGQFSSCLNRCVKEIKYQLWANTTEFYDAHMGKFGKPYVIKDKDCGFKLEFAIVYGETVITNAFSTDTYPPKIKFNIDIKEIIPILYSVIDEEFKEIEVEEEQNKPKKRNRLFNLIKIFSTNGKEKQI